LTNAIHQKKITDTKFKGYKPNKYFISAINNKIEFIHIGKQIKQKTIRICLTQGITHKVSIEEVIIGAKSLPNYDKSCIVIKEWDKPKIDVDSGIEW
jgi:hypothetical protein